MGESPAVSICVPCRNGMAFLGQLKTSLLSQDRADFNVIAVDDASTDGSRHFLANWAAEDPRVACYEGPGQGLYPGWNACVERAAGKYVLFVPCDDTLYKDCLRVACEALDQHPEIDLCAFGVDLIDADGKKLTTLAERNWIWKCLGDAAGRRHIRTGRSEIQRMFWLQRSAFTSMTGLLIRRSLFAKTGPFPSHFGGAGDWAWQLEALRHSDVLHLPEVLSTWRLHEGQVTRSEASPASEFRIFEAWAAKYPGEMTPPMAKALRRRRKWINSHARQQSGWRVYTDFPDLIPRAIRRRLGLGHPLPAEFPGRHPLLQQGIHAV